MIVGPEYFDFYLLVAIKLIYHNFCSKIKYTTNIEVGTNKISQCGD